MKNTKEVHLQRPATGSTLMIIVGQEIDIPQILYQYPGWVLVSTSQYAQRLQRLLGVEIAEAVQVERLMEATVGSLSKISGDKFSSLARESLNTYRTKGSDL